MPRNALGDIVPLPTLWGHVHQPSSATAGQFGGYGPVPVQWTPPSILPDSVLPPALKRVQTETDPLWFPNMYDQQILQQAAVWKYVAENGGLDVTSRITELGVPVYDQDPRLVMPTNAIRFEKVFPLAMTAVSGGSPYNGTDTVLGVFNVDIGYDGIINRFVCSVEGDGGTFHDFTGSVIWRVKIGVRFARDLGNVQNTRGDYHSAFPVPGSYIPLLSGQTVKLIANIPNLSPVNGGIVTAGIFGWIYPRR